MIFERIIKHIFVTIVLITYHLQKLEISFKVKSRHQKFIFHIIPLFSPQYQPFYTRERMLYPGRHDSAPIQRHLCYTICGGGTHQDKTQPQIKGLVFSYDLSQGINPLFLQFLSISPSLSTFLLMFPYLKPSFLFHEAHSGTSAPFLGPQVCRRVLGNQLFSSTRLSSISLSPSLFPILSVILPGFCPFDRWANPLLFFVTMRKPRPHTPPSTFLRAS